MHENSNVTAVGQLCYCHLEMHNLYIFIKLKKIVSIWRFKEKYTFETYNLDQKYIPDLYSLDQKIKKYLFTSHDFVTFLVHVLTL